MAGLRAIRLAGLVDAIVQLRPALNNERCAGAIYVPFHADRRVTLCLVGGDGACVYYHVYAGLHRTLPEPTTDHTHDAI